MLRLTFGIGTVVVLSWLWPDGHAWLAYDRSAIAAGEFWRLLTGHLCHASGAHLGWNLAAFICLSSWLERSEGRRLPILLSAFALGTGIALFAFTPKVGVYVGLSGLNTALTVYLLTTLLVRESGWRRGTAATLLLAAGAKLVFEKNGEAFIFVPAIHGWAPLPEAHMAGAVVGLILATALVTRDFVRTYSEIRTRLPST
ncbi:MAG: rhombosortase [Leptospirillia bacterium]